MHVIMLGTDAKKYFPKLFMNNQEKSIIAIRLCRFSIPYLREKCRENSVFRSVGFKMDKCSNKKDLLHEHVNMTHRNKKFSFHVRKFT